jgi:hypothetical protein
MCFWVMNSQFIYIWITLYLFCLNSILKCQIKCSPKTLCFKRDYVKIHSTHTALTLIATRETSIPLRFYAIRHENFTRLRWNAYSISKSTLRWSYVSRYYTSAAASHTMIHHFLVFTSPPWSTDAWRVIRSHMPCSSPPELNRPHTCALFSCSFCCIPVILYVCPCSIWQMLKRHLAASRWGSPFWSQAKVRLAMNDS